MSEKDISKIATGKKISLIRKELGLTLKEFGELLNPLASDSIVSRWERGVSLPNNKRLKQIAVLGNCSVNDLLNNDLVLHEKLNVPEQKNKHIIPYITNGLYEHFHKQRIMKLEGSSCCVDKSSFVCAMTLKALRENKNLSLFADYKNIEQIKEDKERQAYWSPKTVKDTDEAMKLFWDWYLLRSE